MWERIWNSFRRQKVERAFLFLIHILWLVPTIWREFLLLHVKGLCFRKGSATPRQDLIAPGRASTVPESASTANEPYCFKMSTHSFRITAAQNMKPPWPKMRLQVQNEPPQLQWEYMAPKTVSNSNSNSRRNLYGFQRSLRIYRMSLRAPEWVSIAQNERFTNWTSNDPTSNNWTSNDPTLNDPTSKDSTSKRTQLRTTQLQMTELQKGPNLESDSTSNFELRTLKNFKA